MAGDGVYDLYTGGIVRFRRICAVVPTLFVLTAVSAEDTIKEKLFW